MTEHLAPSTEYLALGAEFQALRAALRECITDPNAAWHRTNPQRRFDKINRIVTEALLTTPEYKE